MWEGERKMYSQNWQQYLSTLKTDFTKLAKLEFLQPNGSVAFALDNQVANKRSKAFIQEGDITVNLQNGSRRQVNISLANLDGAYDYALNKIWFGQQIRLSEGLILPDGTDFYIPQGVFLVENPEEAFEPGLRQASYQLTDKWAAIDGTLGGNLEGAYGVNAGTNIFRNSWRAHRCSCSTLYKLLQRQNADAYRRLKCKSDNRPLRLSQF